MSRRYTPHACEVKDCLRPAVVRETYATLNGNTTRDVCDEHRTDGVAR